MDEKIEQLINDLEEFASDSDMNETGIYTEILDLIHRQNAEIERLMSEIDQRREMMHRMDCNYATQLKKIDELQKQVDKLENRFENKACCNMSENCSMVQQAVKYTAKEICDFILEFWEVDDFVDCNYVVEVISEKYGVDMK